MEQTASTPDAPRLTPTPSRPGLLERVGQWLAARDRELLILTVLTLAGFAVRWFLAIGYALGDDLSYTELIQSILKTGWMKIEPVAQYPFRPMWVYPLVGSVKYFGWDRHVLVLYPVICGSLIPLLTALWVRRHVPPGSVAPVLCAVILQCYPTMFVDSLVLANETPMIFWSLVCVYCFGLASRSLLAPPEDYRSWYLGQMSVLAGTAFCAAYQVKVSAVPLLGLWLALDLLLQVSRQGWPRIGPFVFALVCFLLPVMGVQFFYFSNLGHPLGNLAGEMKLYDAWLPAEYFQGRTDNSVILLEYVRALLLPFGSEGFEMMLHSLWIWLALGFAVLLPFFWKKTPAQNRTVAAGLFLVTLALFLFLEFWPARLKPYYAPNCFSGRPWRYVDPLAPTIAAFIAIILTMPGWFDGWRTKAVRLGVLAAGFGVAGYGIMVHTYELTDLNAEYRQLARDQSILQPYLDRPHYFDVEGLSQLRYALGFPEQPPMINLGSGLVPSIIDLRRVPAACVWTGGGRRMGLSGDDAWSPERIRVIGGELHLVHTWAAPQRPWRVYPLQLWEFFPDNKINHELPTQH